MTKKLPSLNIDKDGILQDIKAFALDMDGTIYLDSIWIEGAKDFLNRVKESGRKLYFLTNNSSKDPNSYIKKLTEMGYPVDESEIVTSGQATIWYLKRYYYGKKVFLLGNHLLKNEFLKEGIELSDKDCDLVVVGFDTELTYDSMTKVCDLVRAGVPYIATHPDYNCPTATGFIPDAGAIMAFIKASAFRDPDIIIGKPNRTISDYLMERIRASGIEDINREEIAMVGDRLYTDIAAGVNSGFKSILVLSGEATWKDAERSEVKPDLIYSSVKEMDI
jgi:HAD superfamily hydrolase (TIGR01450 family)